MSDAIPDGVRRSIKDDLRRLELEEPVRILFAVESGSRAWGFPSPDSDFDARFVYARPVDWYLSLQEGRDVIELPIRGDLDVNGWDIKKALNLLVKPNPVLLEWLSSPIRYSWQDSVCEALHALAVKTAYAKACLHHYLNLAERIWSADVAGKETVKLKKYFYVLRPALCLLWIRERADAIPPMNLQQLIAGLDLPAPFVESVDALLAQKMATSELGEGARIKVIEDVILEALAWARHVAPSLASKADHRLEADALFRAIVRQEL